jgi:hypothetical protein
MSTQSYEITVFTTSKGILTKRLSLNADGTVKKDSSGCCMTSGRAQRLKIDGIAGLAITITNLNSNQAIATGVLRDGLADEIQIVTKGNKLKKFRDAAHIIARTAEFIIYRPRQPAFVLFDLDLKGIPPEVAARVTDFWEALVSVLPGLRGAARIVRRSTSAGLRRSDTGEEFADSGGMHIFIIALDGTDIERFLKAVHDRCWLAGMGWYIVGAAGQLLDRSVIDRMVGRPERLIFEGSPVIEPPLEQDQESRRPIVVEGEMVDTTAICPPLTVVEKSRLAELKAKQAQLLAPEVAKARAVFTEEQTKKLIKRGVSAIDAARAVARWCEGILLPDVVLTFEDSDIGNVTITDILADPDHFVGEAMADPLEGPSYGPSCAKVMQRPDGSLWIYSFAHGRTTYEIKFDARAVQAKIEAARENAAAVFVEFAMKAWLDDLETERLRNLAAELSGITKRTISAMLKGARRQFNKQRAAQERQRRAAERLDPRPNILVPASDDPWLPQMGILDDIHGKVAAAKPPMRNIDDAVARPRRLVIPRTHAFTQRESNDEPEEES